MTQRRRLSNRRACTTISIECGGLAYVATFSRFANGDIAEIFLSNHKSGSASDANARDAAITASLGFQHGLDIETLRKALLRDARGVASTPLGCALDVIALMDGAGNDGRVMTARVINTKLN